MHITFENKVALVTGGASGMGLATGKAFAKSGAKAVVLVDINEQAAKAEADTLVAAGYTAIGIGCDVADEKQVQAMIEQVVTQYGQLDVAYNNAGIQSPVMETADAKGEDFERVIGVNLRGIWNCMKYELIQMRKQGNGAIVNCSSMGGLVGIADRAIYHASKHGVIGLTKSSALEYASRGIQINAVCPGIINTPMVEGMLTTQTEAMQLLMQEIPSNRLGLAEEVASVVLWLCSPMASYVVGQAIAVDGGYTVK